MKVAITGEKGFLGYHLTQHLKFVKNYEVVELGRDFLSNLYKVSQCDWLIHAAGVNRGLDVSRSNIELTQALISKLDELNIKINIAFTSSTQEDLDNEYGYSKKECARLLQKHCIKTDTFFISHKIPNLFGPFGRPNYNSVVATFCYNLANGITSSYNSNTVNLCYVLDAVEVISEFKPSLEFPTFTITVSELLKTLEGQYENYKYGIIPSVVSKFDLNLFNTLRSYMPPYHKLTRHVDDRGYLIELLKCTESQNQVFFSSTNPGIVRGNHFHFGKIERFCVVKGRAKIDMRKVGTTEKLTYIVEDNDNVVVDMPVMYTHNLTNIGEAELVCVFWVNEIFNTGKPDTFFEQV